MTYCSHCGTPNKSSSKFCSNCGALLSAPTDVRCAICGTANRVENVFCSNCGARLGLTVAPSGKPEALAPFNVLVNYWWRDTPAFLGDPEIALLHAILAVRDLPDAARERWNALFDYYVFSPGEAGAHLPQASRGILGPLDAESAGRLRAFILRNLTR